MPATTSDVSVVVPVHGPAPYLESALRTLAGQTLAPDRVVVVDDRAAPGLPERVSAIIPQAQIVQSRAPGVSAARNTGVAASSEALVAFLDSDDLWVGHKLERQVAELAGSKRTAVACSGWLEFRGREVLALRPRHTSFTEGNAMRAVMLEDLVIPSAAMCRRSLVEAAGGFPEGSAYFEDFALFWRLARMGPFAFLPEPLALYRRHVAQATQVFSSDVLHARTDITGPALDEIAATTRFRRRVAAHDRAVAGHWHGRQGRRGTAFGCAVRAAERWPFTAEPYALAVTSVLPSPLEAGLRGFAQARRARTELSPAVLTALEVDRAR